MDLYTSIIIIVMTWSFVIPAALVLRKYYDAKIAMARKMSVVRSHSRDRSSKDRVAVGPAVPAWIPELLDEFGVDEGVLDSDEMPAELSALLPLVRGFLDGGGLQKLLAGSADKAPVAEPPSPWSHGY